MEFRGGHGDHLAHPAVRVHAEALEGHAAVRLAPAAGDAVAAGEIRLTRASVPDRHARRPLPERDDLDAQLVAHDAREGEEGLVAPEGVDIRPADTDAMHAHERLTGRRRFRWRCLPVGEMARFIEDDG